MEILWSFGHFEKVCLKKKLENSGKLHYVEEDECGKNCENSGSYLFNFSSYCRDVNIISIDPIVLTPGISGTDIHMEVNTGSAVSIISQATLDKHLKTFTLEDTDTRLKTNSGEQIRPIGKIQVKVDFNGQGENLDLLVVKQEGPTLMGRNWMKFLRLNWKEIKSVRLSNDEQKTSENKNVGKILEKHRKLFEPGIGKLTNITGKHTLQDGAQPKFLQAEGSRIFIQTRVEEELEWLQQEGVISPIELSDCATPIVPLSKANGTVRICGDYKVNLNPVMKIEQYPLPKVADIFASLSGGQKVSKIDLTQAYLQMEVDEASKSLLTINTHKGLFRFNRLPFGIASAPAIWQ